MKNRVLSVFLFLFTTGLSPYQQSGKQEYELKAAFIYKFTNYIEWDSPVASHDFVIGIIGSSPIEAKLGEIAATKKVANKKIVIRRYNKAEDIGFCHILFISRQSTASLNDIFLKTAGKGTLIVSEKPGYAAQGTGINFILANNKLKFEANPKMLNVAGLKISSQLLKLAIIVDSKK